MSMETKRRCLVGWATVIAVAPLIQVCADRPGEGPDERLSPPRTEKRAFQIDGFVYERMASTSYTLDLAGVDTKLQCDAIALGDASASCDLDGSYSLRATVSDYTPIEVTREGYIPLAYTVWGEGEQTVPLGMYRAGAVAERPGFTKGVVYLDLGTTYPHSFWAEIIAEPKRRMNAELVSYVEVGFNHGCDAGRHTVAVAPAHPDYPDWRFSTEEELAPMVARAHEAGLAFNLWLGTISVNECDGGAIYSVDSNDSVFWDYWFTAYREILRERVRVAKNLGIEWITIGHNMDYVSRLTASRWEAILSEMRAIYPGVRIAYFGAAVLSEDPPYFESDYYNAKSPDGFATLLDALGHAVTAVASEPTPSRDQIKAAFQTVIGKTEHLSVPIWIMPTIASTTVGASDPIFIEPELLTNTIGLDYTTDFYQQADVYQGLFEAINGTPTGDGQVMGVMPWGYHLRNNYRDTGDVSNSQPNVGNLIVDRTANVRGKPAESVLRWWFERW